MQCFLISLKVYQHYIVCWKQCNKPVTNARKIKDLFFKFLFHLVIGLELTSSEGRLLKNVIFLKNEILFVI